MLGGLAYGWFIIGVLVYVGGGADGEEVSKAGDTDGSLGRKFDPSGIDPGLL